jgi:hypothetical protein
MDIPGQLPHRGPIAHPHRDIHYTINHDSTADTGA